MKSMLITACSVIISIALIDLLRVFFPNIWPAVAYFMAYVGIFLTIKGLIKLTLKAGGSE